MIPPLETLHPRRSEWGSSLPPDCFVSRLSISPYAKFLTFVFYGEGLLAPRPTPQAGGPPFVGCPRLFIRFIHSYPPYWRPFFHPQSEDAPCRGDRDPHSWNSLYTKSKRLTLCYRITWTWSDRVNLYCRQIMIRPRKSKTYAV